MLFAHRESGGIYHVGPEAVRVRINELHAEQDEVVFAHALEHLARVVLPIGLAAVCAHGHHVGRMTGAAQRERQYVLDHVVGARAQRLVVHPARVHDHRRFARRADVRHDVNELGPVGGHVADHVHVLRQELVQRVVELVRFAHVAGQRYARVVAVHRPSARRTNVPSDVQQNAQRAQITLDPHAVSRAIRLFECRCARTPRRPLRLVSLSRIAVCTPPRFNVPC